MSRPFFTVLALMLAFLLVGCSQDQAGDSPSTSQNDESLDSADAPFLDTTQTMEEKYRGQPEEVGN